MNSYTAQRNEVRDRTSSTRGQASARGRGTGAGRDDGWDLSRRVGLDVEARNRIVQANLRLVYRVARQYLNRGLMLDDLVGEGNLGLIRAADLYDPGAGTRFSTYATYWIREAILTALANTVGTIRLPQNIAKMLGRWRRAEQALYHAHGHAPSFEEIATAMGLDRPARRLMALAHRVAHVRSEGDGAEEGCGSGLTWLEGGPAPEDLLAAQEEQESLSRWLSRLEAAERTIVSLRYGLAGEPPMSLEQIGDRLGMTAAAVQRRSSMALRKLGGHGRTRVDAGRAALGCRLG